MLDSPMISMRPIRTRRTRRVCLALLAAVSTVLAVRPPGAAGQVAPATLGAAGGLLAGLYTTASVYVVEARFGSYIFSVDDLIRPGPEFIPLAAGLVGGTWLGIRSGSALGRAALWGGVGFLGGAALGTGAGQLIWHTDEGRWAGGIVGSALGMITGAVIGGVSGLDDKDEPSLPATLSLSIPVPLRRR